MSLNACVPTSGMLLVSQTNEKKHAKYILDLSLTFRSTSVGQTETHINASLSSHWRCICLLSENKTKAATKKF